MQVNLERTRSFDLLTIPSLKMEQEQRKPLAFVKKGLGDLVRQKIANQKRPETLLVHGPVGDIKAELYRLLHSHYGTIAYQKKLQTFEVLGCAFEVQKGGKGILYLNEDNLTDWIGKHWIAIAYGDTLSEASSNYLKVFAAEHYPWHRCQATNPNAFDKGWRVSVSSVFIPQDAEFNPQREMYQVRKLSNDFYVAKLLPLSLFLKERPMTTVEKQLTTICSNFGLWRESPSMSEPEKVKRHELLKWNEESILIQQEKRKIG